MSLKIINIIKKKITPENKIISEGFENSLVIKKITERMNQKITSITHDDFISSNEESKNKLIKYWKNNDHTYVCSSKVGSTTIRSVFMNLLDFPFIYKRNNHLKVSCTVHNKKITANGLLEEKELIDRNILFLVRCPFHRVVSSYEYRINKRFSKVNDYYKARGIEINSMNIIEYIKFVSQEIKNSQYNSIIEHFLHQKKSFNVSAYEGTKIQILWQTEKINELLDILSKAFEVDLDKNLTLNKKINDKDKYYHYYIKYPTLFFLVKKTFKEDLDWLNPIFNYEKRFVKYHLPRYFLKYLKQKVKNRTQ